MNKSFRGLMTDGDTVKVRIRTNNGLMGYKIIKFELIGHEPGGDNYESIVKIQSVDPGSATPQIDFSDPTILAAGYYTTSGSPTSIYDTMVIFDDKIINQDFFITYNDLQGSDAKLNYYIEMEQFKLDSTQATVATLKDMRGRE